jgi:hypothetical protein
MTMPDKRDLLSYDLAKKVPDMRWGFRIETHYGNRNRRRRRQALRRPGRARAEEEARRPARVPNMAAAEPKGTSQSAGKVLDVLNVLLGTSPTA